MSKKRSETKKLKNFTKKNHNRLQTTLITLKINNPNNPIRHIKSRTSRIKHNKNRYSINYTSTASTNCTARSIRNFFFIYNSEKFIDILDVFTKAELPVKHEIPRRGRRGYKNATINRLFKCIEKKVCYNRSFYTFYRLCARPGLVKTDCLNHQTLRLLE